MKETNPNDLVEFREHEAETIKKIIDVLNNVSGNGEALFRQLDAKIENTYSVLNNYNNFNTILMNVLSEPFKQHYFRSNMATLAPWFAPGGN